MNREVILVIIGWTIIVGIWILVLLLVYDQINMNKQERNANVLHCTMLDSTPMVDYKTRKLQCIQNDYTITKVIK